MQILRVFNNNVVLAKGPRGEVVVTGRGVGFGARQGDTVAPEKVHKVFLPAHGRDPDHLAEMLALLPAEAVAMVNDAFAEIDAPPEWREKVTVVVAVADHIANAMQRAQDSQRIDYPLEAEVRHLYPAELAMATKFVQAINRRVDTQLPHSEAIAIALHFVNAGFASGDLAFTYTMTGLIEQLLELVEADYSADVSDSNVSAARFITHLRYLFARIGTRAQLTGQESAVAGQIRRSYPRAYKCANRMKSLIELRFDTELSADEVSYLTLHVARLGSERGEEHP